MQHKGTVRLETDRLILRRFRLDDSGAAFQNWTSDKRVTEFLRWPAHDTVNTTKKIIQTWVDGYARDDFYQWAIVLKNNGNVSNLSHKCVKLSKIDWDSYETSWDFKKHPMV